MASLESSAVYVAHFYRGFVIEPTPLGQWMFYRERDDVEAVLTLHAFTIADAVRQIDAIEDGRPLSDEGFTVKDGAAFAAVALLTIAAILWLGA